MRCARSRATSGILTFLRLPRGKAGRTVTSAASGSALEVFPQVGAHARERRDGEIRQSKVPSGELLIHLDIGGRRLQDDLGGNVRNRIGVGITARRDPPPHEVLVERLRRRALPKSFG